MRVTDIIKGHVKEVFNDNESLFDKRMMICKSCPLYKESNIGPICNNRLYMDRENNVSYSPLPGYKRGCGCRLNAKTRLDHAVCGHGKW